MKYLTPSQVLFTHDQVIKRYGGSFGIRELGLVESAVHRPQASFGDTDLYETVFEKAAALLHSLLMNHPFVDGNKRTALAATGIFLAMNGFTLQNTHQEEVTFALAVASEHTDIPTIAQWLEHHTQRRHSLIG